MKKNWFIGIDISKKTLDVVIYDQVNKKPGKHFKVLNETKGFKELLRFLKKEGIIDTVNNIVADEVIEKQSIHADTNINDFIIKSQGNNEKGTKKSKFSSVDSILGDFDD